MLVRLPFSISRIGVTSKGSLIAFTNSYAACFGAEGGDNAAVGVANPVLSHHNVNDIIRPGFIPRCGRSPTIVGRRVLDWINRPRWEQDEGREPCFLSIFIVFEPPPVG